MAKNKSDTERRAMLIARIDAARALIGAIDARSVIPHTDYPARFCEEIVHPETREVIVGAFEAVDSCALSALLDAGADTFIVEAAGIRYRLTAVDL